MVKSSIYLDKFFQAMQNKKETTKIKRNFKFYLENDNIFSCKKRLLLDIFPYFLPI